MTNLFCWEEGASCDNCKLVLRENETMVFSNDDSWIMAGCAILFVFNFVTITSLLFYRRVRQQVTLLFIFSVNFADWIYSIFVLLMLATSYYTKESESEVWSGLCKLFPTLFYLVWFLLWLICTAQWTRNTTLRAVQLDQMNMKTFSDLSPAPSWSSVTWSSFSIRNHLQKQESILIHDFPLLCVNTFPLMGSWPLWQMLPTPTIHAIAYMLNWLESSSASSSSWSPRAVTGRLFRGLF